MVAVCNLCPSSTEGKVWFKFSNSDWFSFIPSTFPFAYNAIDNNNGTYTLKFYRRPTIQQRHWLVTISFVHAETGNTFNTNFFPPNGWCYGDANNPYLKIRMINGAYNSAYYTCGGKCICDEYWVVDIKDKCGNIITKPILNPYAITAANGNTLIHQLNASCQKNFFPQDGGAKSAIAPFISNQVLQPYSISLDTCGNCPSGWEEESYSITGNGQPQLQVICGKACPSHSVCSCTNGFTTCCYDALGNVIDSF